MQTNYQVIESDTAINLASAVNFFLKEGWELQGGVCVTQTLTATVKTYSQALVKNS